MGQITIYIDSEIEKKMKHAARANHVSVSKWVADIIREKVSTEWPRDIVNLAGSWRKDFPSLAEIRSTEGEDAEIQKNSVVPAIIIDKNRNPF